MDVGSTAKPKADANWEAEDSTQLLPNPITTFLMGATMTMSAHGKYK